MCVAARTSNEGVAIHRNKLPTSFLFQLLNTFQITRSNKSISSVFFLIPSPLNIWLSLIPFSKERRKKKKCHFTGNHRQVELIIYFSNWIRTWPIGCAIPPVSPLLNDQFISKYITCRRYSFFLFNAVTRVSIENSFSPYSYSYTHTHPNACLRINRTAET